PPDRSSPESRSSSKYRSTWGAKRIPPSNRRASHPLRPAGEFSRHPLETSPVVPSQLGWIGIHCCRASDQRGPDPPQAKAVTLSSSLQPAESHPRKLLS